MKSGFGFSVFYQQNREQVALMSGQLDVWVWSLGWGRGGIWAGNHQNLRVPCVWMLFAALGGAEIPWRVNIERGRGED